MKAIDMRKKSPDELKALLLERRARREEISIELAQHKVKNVRELRQVKRDIARVLTVISE